MADLAALLLASLNSDSRKQAEQNLNVLASQQAFLSHLLRLVLDPAQDRSVRLSGSIYLKNITKHRWEEASSPLFIHLYSCMMTSNQADQPLAEQDKAALRSELVPAMLALSNPVDKAIRAQVAESVSLIAELDFPTKWTDLIDVSVILLHHNICYHLISF
jgi:exportin-2 (importin alpha re-exporter)